MIPSNCKAARSVLVFLQHWLLADSALSLQNSYQNDAKQRWHLHLHIPLFETKLEKWILSYKGTCMLQCTITPLCHIEIMLLRFLVSSDGYSSKDVQLMERVQWCDNFYRRDDLCIFSSYIYGIKEFSLDANWLGVLDLPPGHGWFAILLLVMIYLDNIKRHQLQFYSPNTYLRWHSYPVISQVTYDSSWGRAFLHLLKARGYTLTLITHSITSKAINIKCKMECVL